MFMLTPAARRGALIALIVFHILVIIASNYLVQIPVSLFGWVTTWGAFSFPFIFLATDLTVRLMGKHHARRVISRVMLPALLASYVVSVLFQDARFTGFAALSEFNLFVFRIAVASFLAYILGQLMDIQVFDRLRNLSQWWVAPAASSLFGQLLDTFVFFSVAFWRSDDPFMAANWIEIATVDYAIKLLVSLVLFVPLYGLFLNLLSRLMPRRFLVAEKA